MVCHVHAASGHHLLMAWRLPGEMLLVEDSYVPSRLWPVVVAAFADLPSVVVNGGVCNGPDGTSTSGRKLGVLSTRQVNQISMGTPRRGKGAGILRVLSLTMKVKAARRTGIGWFLR